VGTESYRRVLLKLSGEAFQGDKKDYGLDAGVLSNIAQQIKNVRNMGVDISVVVGGGNIFRGATGAESGMDRVTADQAGMLATIINGLVLQDALERIGIVTRTMSAIDVQKVCEPYIRRRALRHMEKGRVCIFVAGTGNPYMTTDTAAALRAIEIDADVLLMAKNRVDGVYTADPNKYPDARKFESISFIEALNMRLAVMDATAISLCLENKLPIIVFNLQALNSIERAVAGEHIGTIVGSRND
jgi:uridylate kinase